MRRWGAACVLLAGGMLHLQLAAAQDPAAASGWEVVEAPRPIPPPAGAGAPVPRGADPARGAVLVVMESAGGVRAAGSLRKALNARPELRALSQAELARQRSRPHAILTVSAVAGQVVSVAYWDFAGGRDQLSSPAPARADQMDAVVLALASALLERHQDALVDTEIARTTDALYAVLGRYGKLSPRTNVALHFEEF